MEDQNPRLTTGSSAVYPQFIRGLSAVYQRDDGRSLFLAADQWIGAYLKTLFMQGVSGNLTIPKPGYNTGGSVWGGARRDGGAGRGRAAENADGTVRPGENRPSYTPDDGRITSWAFRWKHEQRKPYLNRWGNKTRV